MKIKKSKNKKSEVIFSEKKQSNLKNQGSIVTEAKNTELKNEIIEENFDIRKAIIYSEIINNPFISKNKIYEN